MSFLETNRPRAAEEPSADDLPSGKREADRYGRPAPASQAIARMRAASRLLCRLALLR